MINYEDIVVSNAFTEGFELSFPSGNSLLITEGIYSNLTSTETIALTFPEIEFDVEGDEEVAVQYDVYLLRSAGSDGFNVAVDRTELGVDAIAFYEGDGELLHCLLSFVIPPGLTDLTTLDYKVRTMKLAPQEEANNDETPTEE